MVRENLIESFQNLLERIKLRQCVIVETRTGWYHSYDKTIIKQHRDIINTEIFRLTYSPETRAIIALRNS